MALALLVDCRCVGRRRDGAGTCGTRGLYRQVSVDDSIAEFPASQETAHITSIDLSRRRVWLLQFHFTTLTNELPAQSSIIGKPSGALNADRIRREIGLRRCEVARGRHVPDTLIKPSHQGTYNTHAFFGEERQ